MYNATGRKHTVHAKCKIKKLLSSATLKDVKNMMWFIKHAGQLSKCFLSAFSRLQ